MLSELSISFERHCRILTFGSQLIVQGTHIKIINTSDILIINRRPGAEYTKQSARACKLKLICRVVSVFNHNLRHIGHYRGHGSVQKSLTSDSRADVIVFDIQLIPAVGLEFNSDI